MRHNRAWKLIGVILLIASIGLVGCVRAKPLANRQVQAVAATGQPASGTSASYRLSLRDAQGLSPSEIAGEALSVAVDNCAGERPLIQQHREELTLQPECDWPESPLPANLVDQEQALHDWVCATYGLADPRPISAQLDLPAPAHGRVTHALRWYNVYDRNVLEVRDAQGQMVSELVIQVHTGARLRLISSTDEPCPGVTSTLTQAVNVPLVVAPPQGDVTVEAPANGPSTEPTWAPGSDEALALAQAYIDALAKQDWATAYALLHPDYRRQVPYKRYVEGYTQVTGITLRGLDVTRLSETEERAEALLTLEIERQGATASSDWAAAYEIVVTPKQVPYGRTIRAVHMKPLPR